jgi:hypothetical protein
MAELKMNRENVRRRELRKENSASVILERQRAKRYYDATPEKQKIRGRRELRKENSASVILKTLGLIHDDPRRLRALANYLEGR